MRGFFAYPSYPPSVGQVIRSALDRLNPAQCDVSSWEENDVAGYPLISPILANINNADLLIADITKVNFNVAFEIGYAIAKGKRAFLTLNEALTRDPLIDLVGIFDIGYEKYNNSEALTKILRRIEKIDAIPTKYLS
jgi:nucleoside 2-deoxyribosyltransferase